MRVRMMDSNGDMQFGIGAAAFEQNTASAVGQLVQARLKLWVGEWFADTTDGTPWRTQVLGEHTTSTYDAAVRARILDTTGVQKITAYSSILASRRLSIAASITTSFGRASVQASSG